MRIIAGKLGGREISSPPGEKTRPAMARTRESLFSMLESAGMTWPGATVLDLFAGTGSLAFESLSRGADCGVLVDNSDDLRKNILRNISALNLQDKCTIIKSDVTSFLRKPPSQKYDLVFIDPPYRYNYVLQCLNLLVNGQWLKQDAFVSAEVENGIRVDAPAALALEKERAFGQTLVKIWKKI